MRKIYIERVFFSFYIKMEKWYECVTCKQMTKGMPATLRNKCLLCRVGELESRYRQRKYEKLPKKKLQAEHGRLNEKLKNLTMKITRLYPVFQKKIMTKMTLSSPHPHPPTPQVTNAKRKL